MTDGTRQREILAKHLAEYYNVGQVVPEACACIAPSCGRVSCFHFWYALLGYPPHKWDGMVQLYEAAYRYTRNSA